MNQRTAAADVKIQLPGPHIARRKRHGEVRMHAAVARFRLDMRRVIRRHGDGHASIVRGQVELAAIPGGTGELGVDTAVYRRSADIAGDALERDAAIVALEANLAADVGDGEAAVVS